MHQGIPRRIIQTGKTRELGLKDRAAVCNLKLLNPDFEYLFFDNEQVASFIDRQFPQYRGVFDSFRFKIQRYDFFRYLAIYHYGGFYFDLDVFLAASLSGLLDAKAVFPFEGLTFSTLLRTRYAMDWQIGNYGFGAAPGHPLLRLVIENCVRAQREPDWAKPMMRGAPRMFWNEFLVLNTTGPGLLTRTLAENPGVADTVTVLFPDDVCDPQNWNRFGDLGIHLMDGSWRTQRNFLFRRIGMYWEAWKMRRLLKQSRKSGKTRLMPAGL